MKLHTLLFLFLANLSLAQVQAPKPTSTTPSKVAARPPVKSPTAETGAGAAGPPSTGGAAAGPPSGGNAAAGPPSGGSAAAGPPSGGNAAAGPPSGGNAAAGPPSGGNAAAGPPSGGNAAAGPPTGGNAAEPPSGIAARPPTGSGSGNQVVVGGPEVDQSQLAAGEQASYACPGDDGKRYTTGGITYQLKCGQGTYQARYDYVPAASLKECAQLCAADPRCQSCDYNNQGYCALFPDYIPTVDMPSIQTWFPIEKRPDPPPKAPYCPKPKAGVQAALDTMAAKMSTDPVCDGDNGKIYASSTGLFFVVECATHKANSVKIDTTQQPSLAACMDHCSNFPGCQSAVYGDGKSCYLYDSNTDATVPCPGGNHKHLKVTDPPCVKPEAEEPEVQCATECPGAHGKIYTTAAGEVFQLSCCTRHALCPLLKVYAGSMQECVEKCSAVAQCSSVDYQIEAATCYLGNRHSAAIQSANGWASAHSLGNSGACKSCRDCKAQGAVGGPGGDAISAAVGGVSG